MVENIVTTITDPETSAIILQLLRESEEDEERRPVDQRRDELFEDIINNFPPGTYFDRNKPTNRVRATPITMNKMPPSAEYPVPANHGRFYGDLKFKYTDHDDGFNMFSTHHIASFKTTFEFIVCAHAIFDTRSRGVDNEDPYCSKWILVGIPRATLAALREKISGSVRQAGYTLSTTNFEVTYDGKYVTTVAGLKEDPRFVEITELEQDYIGDLKSVYESRSRNGVHKGLLIFDPYLVAVVPDNDPAGRLPECQLHFRLVGIRSFGESPGSEIYFPHLNRLYKI